jgi:hypothetical protein
MFQAESRKAAFIWYIFFCSFLIRCVHYYSCLWGTYLLSHKTLHSLSLLSVSFHLTLLLRMMCSVDSVEQTPSWEATSCSDVKEILCLN